MSSCCEGCKLVAVCKFSSDVTKLCVGLENGHKKSGLDVMSIVTVNVLCKHRIEERATNIR